MAGFDLNNAPKSKPSEFDNSPVADGLHKVEIEKVEYTQSTQGNPMLSIRFKTLDKGRFIFDQIMDDPTKQINAYRVVRLLAAVGIEPKGELQLKDLTKLLKLKTQLVVAVKTKNNYTNVDISGSMEGYYSLNDSPLLQGHPDPVGEPGVLGTTSSDFEEDDSTEDDPFPPLETADTDADF